MRVFHISPAFSIVLLFLIPAGVFAIDIPIVMGGKVTVGPNGDIYILSTATDRGLPVSAGALQPSFAGGSCLQVPGRDQRPCQDLYIQRRSGRDGSLLAATYWGGSDDEYPGAITVDPAGNVYVAGASKSPEPAAAGGFGPGGENVLLILTPDLRQSKLARRYSFTGSFQGITFDRERNQVWLAGTTAGDLTPRGSIPQPQYGGGAADLLLMRVDPANGEPEYAAFLGTELTETFAGFALGTNGDVLLATNAPARAYRLTAGGTKLEFARLLETERGRVSFLSALVSLPDGSSAFGGRLETAGAQTGFVLRLNAAGEAVAPAIVIGDTVKALERRGSELLIAGEAFVGLETSPRAPQRCRAGGLEVFFALTSRDDGQPNFVTYVGSPQPDFLAAMTSEKLLRWSQDRLVVDNLPRESMEETTCLDPFAVNFGSARAPALYQNPAVDSTLSPGAFVTLFGGGFTEAPVRFRPEVDGGVPRESNGLRVLWNGRALGLIEVSRSDVSVALPFDLPVDEPMELEVERNGRKSGKQRFSVAAAAPVFLTPERTGPFQFCAYDRQGRLVNAANPSGSGEEITLYVSGIGNIDRTLDEASIDSEAERSRPVRPVEFLIPGAGAPGILYVGTVPGQLPGLTQVNLRLPEKLPAGRLFLTLRVAGRETTGLIWGR